MISTSASFAAYIATAGQTVFAYNFRILNQSDLRVYTENSAGVRSDITGNIVSVTGVDNEAGGNVTIPAQTLGTRVFLVRASTLTQLWDASSLNFFDPAAVERVVDKLTVLAQETNAISNAAIRLAPGEVIPPLTRADRAGKIATFDANGNLELITRNTAAENVTEDAIAAKNAAEAARDAAEVHADVAEAQKDAAAVQAGVATAAATAAGLSQVAAAGSAVTADSIADQMAIDSAQTLADMQAVADTIDPAQFAKFGLGNTPDAAVIARLIAAGSVSLGKLAADVLTILQNSGFDPAKYQGLWTPATNTPVIPVAAVGNTGHWYFVQAAGTAVGNAAGTYAYGDCVLGTGATWLKRPAPPTVLAPESVDFAKLSLDLQGLLAPFQSFDYAYAIVDTQKRMALGIRSTGEIVGKFILQEAAVSRANLTTAVTEKLPDDLVIASGYSYVIVDSNNRIVLGITDTGRLVCKLGTTSLDNGAVTRAKLSAQEQRLSLNQPGDVVPVMPDDWRFTDGRVATKTANGDGSRWRTLQDLPTRLLRFVNTTGTSLDFRRGAGLVVRGNRYIGTWDPSAAGVNSTNYRGSFQNATSWPPAGVFAAGDYYEFMDTGRTIGADNYVRGDLAVWNGAAWVRQAGPGGSPEVQDWWAVTGAATFGGVAYAVGDRILFIGGQPGGGNPMPNRWIKGEADGAFFSRGDFNPAGGLPASPANGELWQASAAGTTGGFTFAVGDYLVREDGVWGQVANDVARSCANGSMILLPCFRSASEWEVRRTDRSSASVGVVLKLNRRTVARRHKDEIVWWGDSMPGFIIGAAQTAFSPRSIIAKSYGGGSSQDVLNMMRHHIRALGDTEAAKLHVFWHGQNNQGDPAQIRECSLRMAELVGARDGRYLFCTVLGQRSMSYNGVRLVCAQQENQFNKVAGSLWDIVDFYARTFPSQFLDLRAELCARATTTPDLQFPGMTEAQVAATYGIAPLSGFLNYTTALIDPALLVFKGYHSTAGLPVGGVANDYYIRTANGTVGNLLVNQLGIWTEVTFDITHISTATGTAATAAALADFITAKAW